MINNEFRKRIIKKYFINEESAALAARLIDKYEAVCGQNTPQSTKFQSLQEIGMASRLLEELGQRFTVWGGYAEAERACIILLPDWMEEGEVKSGAGSPVAVIRAIYKRYADIKLSHRDFLGALMGLGLERDTIGDILTREDSCDIVVLREILGYVLANLEQAGKVKLTLEIAEEAEPAPQKHKLIKDTVASLRLDAVASSGFSLSREKTMSAVKSGKVSINGFECVKPDKLIQEGDKISLRGTGKLELAAVKGYSRKGRIIIEIKLYQ